MAKVRICELNPAGSEFFKDPESFLHALEEDELAAIAGGLIEFNSSNLDLSNIRNLTIQTRNSFNFNYFRNQGGEGNGVSNTVNNNSVNQGVDYTINGQGYNANSNSNFNSAAY